MSIKTPLKKVRGLGATGHGTDHLWIIRVTSVALLFLVIGFIIFVFSVVGADYAEAKALVSSPIVAILLLLLVTVSCHHMHMGMQTICEDYIHTEGLKVLALMGNTIFSIIVCAACVFAVLKVSFGS